MTIPKGTYKFFVCNEYPFCPLKPEQHTRRTNTLCAAQITDENHMDMPMEPHIANLVQFEEDAENNVFDNVILIN